MNNKHRDLTNYHIQEEADAFSRVSSAVNIKGNEMQKQYFQTVFSKRYCGVVFVNHKFKIPFVCAPFITVSLSSTNIF